MNKQQLIKNLGYVRYSDTDDERYNYYNKGIDTAISFAKKLDEPGKPVVPQYVADWYEENKDDFENSLAILIRDYFKGEIKDDNLFFWIGYDLNKDQPIKTLVNMHQFGYEVEKEKLYTVELPNHNSDGSMHIILIKTEKGICIDCYSSISYRNLSIAQLTETEIKKDFEWAWQFAEEVEK